MARPLYAVLANPGIHVPTPSVFARMGFEPGETRDLGDHPVPHDGLSHDEFVALVKGGRNDMEAAALSLAPEIGDAIDVALRHGGASRRAHVGIGVDLFRALRRPPPRRARPRNCVAGARPDWWIRATALR